MGPSRVKDVIKSFFPFASRSRHAQFSQECKTMAPWETLASIFTAILNLHSIFHFCNSQDLFIKPVKSSEQNLAFIATILVFCFQMSRNSIPFYTDASYLTPMGTFTERTRSMGTTVIVDMFFELHYKVH